ncbi:unnamed protein product [Adineta ricciae]|uniref:Uncharacterized protein n=1 Tax=Adineta ricciae TaxID=249248 RepID=A0A814V1L7_ADIRI|nr:unnamed protein product [Adineta ricciae]
MHSQSTVKELLNATDISNEKKSEKSQTVTHNINQNRYSAANSKWASPISGILNDEELRLEQKKAEKSKRLEQRRNHLSAILEADKNKYQSELLSYRRSSHEAIPPMNMPIDFFQSASEHSPQPETTNNFDLQTMEIHKLQDLSFEQRDDKQNERKRRHQQLKLILQQQMEEFNQLEKQAELFKQEEEHWYKEQIRLEEFQEIRRQTENFPIQQDQGRQLLRQHKAKLHKRSKEVQQRLDMDIDILTSIVHPEYESRLEQFDEQKQLKENVSNVLQQFQQQMRVEKNKEKEVDDMYPEDAAKQWSRYDQQWNDEQKTRMKLLRPILTERQNQLIKQLHLFKEKQKEIYEKQRTLIEEMEQARKYDLIEKQKQTTPIEQKPQIFIVRKEPEQPIEYEESKQTFEQPPLIPTTDSQFHGRRRIAWN